MDTPTNPPPRREPRRVRAFRSGRLAALLPLALIPAALAQNAPEAPLPEGERRAGQQFDFSLMGGLSWSDNIERVPIDEEDGMISRAGVRLRYLQVSRRLDTDIDVNTMFDHYQDDVFEDDIVGGVNATLTMGIVPERFLWIVQDNFGQVSSDPFAAPTPENQENLNYLTTGPDFIVRMGDATSLKLSGRYSDVKYELTNADNQQTSGTLSLARQTSGSSTFSLVGDALNVDYQDESVPAYDRYEGYLRYALDNTRTELSIDGGYTWLKSGDQEDGGLLARVLMTRRVSAAAVLSASAGTEFSDAADIFRGGQTSGGAGGNGSQVLGSSDPFENRYVSLGYDFDRHRTAFGLRVQYRKELYVSADSLDRQLTIYSAYLTRHFSPKLEARIYVDFEDQDYDQSEFASDELRAGGYLSWAVGRTLSLRIDLDHIDRQSSDPLNEYTENRATLFIVYSPVRRQ